MTTLETILLIAQLASTLPLVGLIWTIQLVHYPLFELVGEDTQIAYQKAHMSRITWIVAPLMLVELVAAGGLWLFSPTDPWAIAGAVLVAIIWVSTALIQVPCHNRLAGGFDQPSHRRLVDSNWIRTIAWSLRGGVVVIMAGIGL